MSLFTRRRNRNIPIPIPTSIPIDIRIRRHGSSSSRHRNPPIIQELNRRLLQLQRYLYNFYIQNIKKLAFKTGLPIQFFRQKYEREVNIAIHRFVEQVYFKTIENLQRKLLLKHRRRRRRQRQRERERRRQREREREQRRLRQRQRLLQQQQQYQQQRQQQQVPPPRTQEIEVPPPLTIDTAVQSLPSSFFTSVLDINNINQIATTTTDNYFNAVGRLIDRASTVSWSQKITALETVHQLMLFAEMAAFQRVANYAAYNTFNTAIQSKLQQINDDDTHLQYITAQDEKVCPICLPFDGKVYLSASADIPELPQHPNCRCFLEPIILEPPLNKKVD